MKPLRAAFLCHDRFEPDNGKTTVCLIRYPWRYQPVAVVDRSKAGQDASQSIGAIGNGIPVVASVAQALALKPEVLVIGIAPRGGVLPEEWRPDLRAALNAGMEIHSGLHFFLNDDPELAALAKKKGLRLWDVRQPQRPNRIASGAGSKVQSLVVHTVGTDCSIGKMTVSVEVVQAARKRGIKAAFAATGQTGIMVGAQAGAPIDRVISDFVAGAAEELVVACDQQGYDLTVVEGQGSIVHPAYSGVTVGLLHGAQPDQLILCHQPGRDHVKGYESQSIAPLRWWIQQLEALCGPVKPARVVAIALDTHRLDDAAAKRAITAAEQETGLPATDCVRYGSDKILDAIVAGAAKTDKPAALRLRLHHAVQRQPSTRP